MRNESLKKARTPSNDELPLQGTQGVAPGKVTRTSRMAPAGAQPVQRKAQDSAQDGAGVRPVHAWMNDPAILAAHGVTPVDQPVQRQAAEGAAAQEQAASQERSGGFLSSVGNGIKNTARGVKDHTVGHDRFEDVDATMYRVTMDGGERKVEQIARQVDDEGNVSFVALGRVTGFEGQRPVVEPYDPPRNLGNWAPRVTHVNGMMVTPEGGIGGAESLHESIAASLDDSAMPPDVLYTYSATGGFFPDLIDSAKGKLGMDDEVIHSQETLILDAVHSGRRISVSAHSRGTIKTDVAVRNAHTVLRAELEDSLTSSPEADQAAEEAMIMAQKMAEAGRESISPILAGEIARQAAAKKLAGQRAWDAIEEHVQLIYAGNAVKLPAPPAELVVGRTDFVSMTVGTYFKLGRDIKRFEKISGGHGFDENYAATVGEWIAADLAANSQ